MFTMHVDDDVELSIFEPRHAESLFQLVDKNRDRLGVWLSFPEKTREKADSLAFIRKSLTRMADGNGFWAGILYKGELAGSTGFLYIDQEAGRTEIGYWIGADFTGRGLVTKAVRKMVDYAFFELGLRKVNIQTSGGNGKSRAVPERLGFTKEGVLREYEYLNGSHHDRIVYGLLKEEWGEF
ncbi:GNAT family N-acetyltransferase [Halobacillus kuroshimensis]|uniref:GNAT family N-acetyltransferase n=1 Tax=Halobacillus kuroshimensis TaxID=302481 RepID=A0ABS3DRX8_9BACI|nr:GNAT family protein [Halobacillus kuroshimensis]MBN8234076.1 GNAT family N-acetyltransferase [Halobacillus kuroshimensis]